MSEANSGPGRVTREQRGQLFLIGLDRAGKRNAFDSAMLTDLALAIGEYERNERCAAPCCSLTASTSPPVST
jgi:enoyl-CoA hydratase